MASSTTLTQVVPPAPSQPTLVLRLCAETEKRIASTDVVQNLASTLLRHSTWKDYLSRRLFEWGNKFIVSIQGDLSKPLSEILLISMVQIDQLREILRHPFGQATIKDPWLVPNQDLMWEKIELERYQECLHLSARNRVNAIPHEFAKAMLGWLKSLPLEPAHHESIAIDNRDKDTPIEASEELKLYELLIKTVQRDIESRKGIEKATKEIEIQRRSLTETLARAQREQDQLDRLCKGHVESIRQALSNIQAEHQKTIALLKTRISELEHNVQECQEDLREAKRRVSSLESSLSNLQAQYQSLAGQVSAMQNNDGGCVIS